MLAAPKSNKVLFTPRIAQRWTESDEPVSPTYANDNGPLMTGIETEGASVLNTNLFESRRTDWQAKPMSVPASVVPVFDDGPSNNPPVANDNVHTIAWPLGKALKVDRQFRLLRAAAAYRRLDELVNVVDCLRGANVEGEAYKLDQRTWVNPKGEIVYKGARVGTSGDPKPVQPTKKSGNGKKVSILKTWDADDLLHLKIDAGPLLDGIEDRVGPLLQPVQAAVIDSKTMEEIGRLESGHSDKQRASAVGKALVYRGLAIVASYLEEPGVQRKLPDLGLG